MAEAELKVIKVRKSTRGRPWPEVQALHGCQAQLDPGSANVAEAKTLLANSLNWLHFRLVCPS